MKLEELAFVNQQLAGMINSGMPLEGALREVCTGMAKGGVKEELSALEADLAKGKPLADALGPRKLPDFYKSMLEVGAKAGDLPSILNLLEIGRASCRKRV